MVKINKKATKHNVIETVKATCIPLTNIIGSLVRSFTGPLENEWTASVKIVVDSPTPKTMPRFLDNAFNAPAIPKKRFSTAFIMMVLFGAWNKELPIEDKIIEGIIIVSGLVTCHNK